MSVISHPQPNWLRDSRSELGWHFRPWPEMQRTALHRLPLKPKPNDRNIWQHCWEQHVMRIWQPCCDVLGVVAQIWNWSNFSCQVCRCCSRLARFVQQCRTQACALNQFSIPNKVQHVTTGWSKAWTCCAQQCWDMLHSNVAIVWPELANAEPTMLRYVELKSVEIVWPGL